LHFFRIAICRGADERKDGLFVKDPNRLAPFAVILGSLEGFTGPPPKQKSTIFSKSPETLKICSVTNLRANITNIYSFPSFCGVLVVKFELLVIWGGSVVWVCSIARDLDRPIPPPLQSYSQKARIFGLRTEILAPIQPIGSRLGLGLGVPKISR
jgi:hypothetical protein